jgi:hypothetical protein
MVVFFMYISFDSICLEVEVFPIEKHQLERVAREFLFQLELNIATYFITNRKLRKIYLVFLLLKFNRWCCNMQEDLQRAPFVLLFVSH